jgi:hypothetical protein
MDVARSAVRSAATGSYNPESGGAGVAAVMKLAPNVDVEKLQVTRMAAQGARMLHSLKTGFFCTFPCSF